MHIPDSLKQSTYCLLFQNIPRSAGNDGFKYLIFLFKYGLHQYFDGGVMLADQLHRFDTVDSRHADIHQYNVRHAICQISYDLETIFINSDTLEVGFIVDEK